MDLDASVIARLRAGDVDALELCYRSFGPRVQRLCRRLVGRDQAEDAAQEVFVKVFERAAQFSGKSRFSTWLYQITLNHCLQRSERERRRKTLPLPLDQVAPWAEAPMRAVDDRDQVESWIAQLCDEQRAVIVLRELEGLDYREIAEVLGVPIGTVMSRLSRAREKLTLVVNPPRLASPHVKVLPT
ncbi:MAG TPA: RNA polymerase sigma factor [Planctomycetota bacterium]|nr:RNA polymerase sigma factor [Planctomycetota bacterium]